MADDKKTPPAAAEQPAPDPHEGPGKGQAFFDRGKTVAATGNYDYAIEMYIQGLNREPFNVEEHKALREVAMRRRMAGVKSGGGLLGMGGAKMPFKGKSPKEGLLNNEFTLSRDVGNISAMLAIIRNAVLINLKDVVVWIGPLVKEANRTNKTPKVEIYTELGEIYAKLEEFERACDALNEAVRLKPQDSELSSLAQQYAAEATMKRGKYGDGESFKGSIKDVEATRLLNQEENLSKSEEYLTKMLESAKADYEANPKEMQVINKYIKSLWEMNDEEHENQAIGVLKKAFEETKIYRFKAQAGDFRMRQFKRNLRVLKEALRVDPKDKDMLHEYERVNKDRLAYELQEFKERMEHMPTDLEVKYQLGVRHWEAKHFDDAIPMFQEATNNPKRRVESLHFLARCFLQQGMKPEAVETARRSIEMYELAASGDKKAKDLHYWFARSLEENKQLAEAIDVYSKLTMWDIGFLDARKRLTELRAQLEAAGEAAKPT